jgi:L-aspartate oxidase
MDATGADHVWLDATDLEHFAARFPTITADLLAVGLDPSTDWLPVAPAAHHQCGGVLTDLDGATSLPGLWAAGETGCTGVHGANRLASNSLLEGMVFGPRAVEAIASGAEGPQATGAMRVLVEPAGPADALRIPGVPLEVSLEPGPTVLGRVEPSELRAVLQQAMSSDAGVLRDASRLARCAAVVDDVLARLGPGGADAGPVDVAVAEVRNLAQIARVLVAAATARTESRGVHARIDHPHTDPEQCHRLVVGGDPDAVQHSSP